MVLKSELYREIVSPNSEFRFGKLLIDLDHVGATAGNAFVLYLLAEQFSKPEIIERILSYLVKYFTIRNITNFPRSNDLDTIFIALTDKCQGESDLTEKIVVDFLSHSSRQSPKENVARILNGPIYTENSKILRYLLCMLEDSMRNSENRVDLWAKNEKGKYEWTIEHIQPEGKNIPGEWVEMLSASDKETATIIQERCVHKLGNLTLSRYNSRLSNFAFDKKKNLENGSQLIGYSSGAVHLNESVLVENSWNEATIEKRTAILIEEILSQLGIG